MCFTWIHGYGENKTKTCECLSVAQLVFVSVIKFSSTPYNSVWCDNIMSLRVKQKAFVSPLASFIKRRRVMRCSHRVREAHKSGIKLKGLRGRVGSKVSGEYY